MDCHQIMRAICEGFGITWPVSLQEGDEALDALISPAALHHHHHAREEQIACVLRDVYGMLLRAGANGSIGSKDQGRLDRIRKGLMNVPETMMSALAGTSGLIAPVAVRAKRWRS